MPRNVLPIVLTEVLLVFKAPVGIHLMQYR